MGWYTKIRESSFNMERGGGHEDIEGGPEILRKCAEVGGSGKMIGSQGGHPFFP